MKRISISFAALTLLALAATVSANGLPGQRLEKDLGTYVIDIGTDQEFTPQAGAPVKFDFNLLSGQAGVTLPGGLSVPARNPVPYTDVNVRVIQDGKPLAESDIAYAQSGPTFFTFAFPTGGTFTLQTTFYSKDKQLADASFPLTIGGDAGPSGSSSGGGRSFVLGLIVGIVIGVVIGFFVSSSFRKKAATI